MTHISTTDNHYAPVVLPSVDWCEVSCGEYSRLDKRGRTIACGGVGVVTSFYKLKSSFIQNQLQQISKLKVRQFLPCKMTKLHLNTTKSFYSHLTGSTPNHVNQIFGQKLRKITNGTHPTTTTVIIKIRKKLVSKTFSIGRSRASLIIPCSSVKCCCTRGGM